MGYLHLRFADFIAGDSKCEEELENDNKKFNFSIKLILPCLIIKFLSYF